MRKVLSTFGELIVLEEVLYFKGNVDATIGKIGDMRWMSEEVGVGESDMAYANVRIISVFREGW